MSHVARPIDVLVVGLGPAGASAARVAAEAGASVVAIDRKRLAGLPVQCAELVPAMIGGGSAALEAARRQPVHSMSTFVEEKPPHERAPFPGTMIDRVTFDAALVAQAERAGAECWLSMPLRGLEADGTATLADGSRLAPRVVIGADGPHSAVGRAVDRVVSEIAETRQMTVPLLEPFTATDIFLSARLPGGYAWLFPKCEVANLGLGVAPRWRERLKPLLDDLHAQLVRQGRVGREVLSWTGGAIPVSGPLDPVAQLGRACVLLAGDAAGLTNPITGAGINAAVLSGELAGAAAAGIAAGDASAATGYAEDIEDQFGASLARALTRRKALMTRYSRSQAPSVDDLQRAWIAFPEYWAA